MLKIVFDAGDARRDQLRRIGWFPGVDNPQFRCVVIMYVDDDVLVGIGLAHAGELACVTLLEDQRIGRLFGAKHMTECLEWPVVLVLERVEIALAVGSPGGAAGRVLQHVGHVDSGSGIAHANLVELRTIAIEGPRRKAVIRGHGDVAKVEIFAAGCQRIAIEQQMLRPLRPARPAAEARMLPAGDIGGIVIKWTVRSGHRGVILLDAALQFREQLLLQRRGAGHHRFMIGILAFEYGADIRRQNRGIMHHLLPVLGLEPMIIVVFLIAVPGFDTRTLFRARRLNVGNIHGLRPCRLV